MAPVKVTVFIPQKRLKIFYKSQNGLQNYFDQMWLVENKKNITVVFRKSVFCVIYNVLLFMISNSGMFHILVHLVHYMVCWSSFWCTCDNISLDLSFRTPIGFQSKWKRWMAVAIFVAKLQGVISIKSICLFSKKQHSVLHYLNLHT